MFRNLGFNVSELSMLVPCALPTPPFPLISLALLFLKSLWLLTFITKHLPNIIYPHGQHDLEIFLCQTIFIKK